MKRLVMFLAAPFVLSAGKGMACIEKKAGTHPRTSRTKATWNSFKPETLAGIISMMESKKKEIFVTASDRIPHYFLVTRKAKIEICGVPSSFDQLTAQDGSQATITFIARPEGSFAKRISVSG